MNIAFLIPSTSKDNNWNNIYDSYLYNCVLKTLTQEEKINYTRDPKFAVVAVAYAR